MSLREKRRRAEARRQAYEDNLNKAVAEMKQAQLDLANEKERSDELGRNMDTMKLEISSLKLV
jgi:hypothetical protein